MCNFRTMPNLGKPKASSKVGLHPIQAHCHTLQGALGAQILCFGGIDFENKNVTLRGPLLVAMAPGVPNLQNASAIQSAGDLRAVAPEGSVMHFKHISSTSPGAALHANHNIWLEGLGTMMFENVASEQYGGAVGTFHFGVVVTVANIAFLNCSARFSGGAICAGSSVHLDSRSRNDTIRFESCKAGWRGGAVASWGETKLTGAGSYFFEQCHAVFEGGALAAAKSDIMIALEARGSVDFRECTTNGQHGENLLGGGAASAIREVHLSSGRVRFSGCLSDSQRGNAVMVANGILRIDEEARVLLAGMNASNGPAFFARIGIIPPAGDVLPSDVFYMKNLLASRAMHQHDDKICPPGSRFLMRADGSPELGKCVLCPISTISLAPSYVKVDGEVTAPAAGMRVVLVHRSSPNSLSSLGIPLISNVTEREDSVCAKAPGCLQLGFAAGEWDAWWECAPLVLARHDALLISYRNRQMHTAGGGKLAVPWELYQVGTPITVVEAGQTVAWTKGDSQIFEIKQGVLTPSHAPLLTMGLAHDVSYIFEPRDPNSACQACSLLPTQLADKLRCPGGGHVQSLPGYMFLHKAGERTLQVHKCPNKVACPGSKLALRANGQPSSRSRFCAEGYEPMAGCVRCTHGYGRPQLDPFTCQAGAEPSCMRIDPPFVNLIRAVAWRVGTNFVFP